MLRTKFQNFWISLPILYLGWASLFSILFTLEWTYTSDGQSLLAYGFPFPWMRFSQVSSMEWDIQIIALALNLLCFMLPVCFFGEWLKVRTWNKGIMGIPWAHILGGIMIILSALFLRIHGKYYYYDRTLFDKQWQLETVDFHYGVSRDYYPKK